MGFRAVTGAGTAESRHEKRDILKSRCVDAALNAFAERPRLLMARMGIFGSSLCRDDNFFEPEGDVGCQLRGFEPRHATVVSSGIQAPDRITSCPPSGPRRNCRHAQRRAAKYPVRAINSLGHFGECVEQRQRTTLQDVALLVSGFRVPAPVTARNPIYAHWHPIQQSR